MAVSLGMRVSGLLFVGALAVAVAAVTGVESGDTPDRGGGNVTAGPSNGARPPGPVAVTSVPAGAPSPAGQAAGPGRVDDPTTPPAGSPGARTLGPSPTPSAPGAGGSVSPIVIPAWLPPGPDAPDTDATPDPASVYDRLRSPDECRSALGVMPRTPEDPQWRLLRGLATACLAVQGLDGAGWETAARDYRSTSGAETCKGRAARAVLGGLLDFHRRHPGTTVRLEAAPDGPPACAYEIVGVDTGGDSEAQPGDTIGVELRGTYFDHAELLLDGSVLVGGRPLPGPPVLRSESGDRLVLTVVVPHLETGDYPLSADVVVRYGGTEAALRDAFTVVTPTQTPGTPGGAVPTPS